MEHYFDEIFGMFDYADLYKSMINRIDNGVFVEIGSLYGKSAVYMGVEITNACKDIQLHCVDSWSFDVLDLRENHPMNEYMTNRITGEDVFTKFKKNITPVSNIVGYHKLDSVKASSLFNDRSVDFVFIDGDHSYVGCLNDILAWLPKVKIGGYIAGHDFNDPTQPGVTDAVYQVLGKEAVTTSVRCWIYHNV
jgi:predicted O-methyltransferase YrrM